MKRKSSLKSAPARRASSARKSGETGIVIDRYRAIVFPNNVREWRRRRGFPKLLALSAVLPQIPYVRLSKIERGEVVAKAGEVMAIAEALKVEPGELIVDIDAPGFDIAEWAADLQDWVAVDPDEDRLAVLLAAALRARREGDKALTIAALERDYGIAPVILSRLENAYKTLDRWNAQTVDALCRIFGVDDMAALAAHAAKLHAQGTLDPHLDLIANPALRIVKTRMKVVALKEELAGAGPAKAGGRARPKAAQPRREAAPIAAAEPQPSPVIAAIQAADTATIRLVPVFGTPLPDGLIARTASGERVEAPLSAGPNAYGLRVCRPTLGPGLPARATVVVDPDRFPSSGGLAVVREAAGLRLLMVTFGRDGRMMGYSEHPDREVALDDFDPTDVATVIGAVYE